MNDNAPAREPEEPRFYFSESARGPAIYHNPGPNSLRFPVLFLSEDITHPQATGQKVAELLNEHWETGK